MKRHVKVFLCVLAFLVSISFTSSPAQGQSNTTERSVRILVVSLTPDFRHESIPAGNQALQELGHRIAEEDPEIEEVVVDIIDSEGKHARQAPTEFPRDASALSKYDVLVFNNSNDANPPNSTDILVLDEEQAAAFETYIRSGGGFVGIHSAVDNQTADSFFSRVLGAYFEQHAAFQEGIIQVTDPNHPSTRHLPSEWKVTSEWYTFVENPRDRVHVLLSADDASYEGKGMENHPMAWTQKVAGGRSWYTALGHAPEHFEDEHFREHLLGGIRWAAGLTDGSAPSP